jgi:2-dehydropantoate 2-reductase
MTNTKTRIAIIGIGGIGGYIGSKLASKYTKESNIEIIFIQRGKHFEVIKSKGLTYSTQKDTISHPHIISSTPDNLGIFDIIFFTVKSKDLETVAQSLQKNINNNTILIPVLNGVNNARRIQKIYPNNQILNACIYVSASIKEPGTVKQVGGTGMLYFGAEDGNVDKYKFIEEILTDANIKAELSNNIQKETWTKYIFIASLATITSYTGKTIGEIVRDKQQKMQWVCLVKELIFLAEKNVVQLDNNILEKYIERATNIPIETKTSMQIDIEKGNIPEFDVFVEYPIILSRKLGIHNTVYNEYYAKLKTKLKI